MTATIATQTDSVSTSVESKKIASWHWLGSFFVPFLVSLYLYATRKQDSYIRDQARESLNWSANFSLITWSLPSLIAYGAGADNAILVKIGVVSFFAMWIMHMALCIKGAIASSKGEPFKVPFMVRLYR